MNNLNNNNHHDNNSPETSFIKQSLTDTIQTNHLSRPSTIKSNSTNSSRSKRLFNLSRAQTINTPTHSNQIKNDKSEADTVEILKSLGLKRGSTIKNQKNNSSNSQNQSILNDWEEIECKSNQIDLDHHHQIQNIKSEQSISNELLTPKPKKIKNKTTKDRLKIELNQILSEQQQQQQQQDQINKAKTRDLQHKSDERILGPREFEELEKQFDAQEKLLSGYQRENERSLIELESTKSKMIKMSSLLSKAYGPDWEDLISSANNNLYQDLPQIGCSTTTTNNLIIHQLSNQLQSQDHHHHHQTDLNSKSTSTTISNDQLSLQLSQIQLLVQGMEKRLVSRQIELDELNHQTKLDQKSLKDSFDQINQS